MRDRHSDYYIDLYSDKDGFEWVEVTQSKTQTLGKFAAVCVNGGGTNVISRPLTRDQVVELNKWLTEFLANNPDLPEEPPVGSTVILDGINLGNLIYKRNDRGWGPGVGGSYCWKEVVKKARAGTLRVVGEAIN